MTNYNESLAGNLSLIGTHPAVYKFTQKFGSIGDKLKTHGVKIADNVANKALDVHLAANSTNGKKMVNMIHHGYQLVDNVSDALSGSPDPDMPIKRILHSAPATLHYGASKLAQYLRK